MEDCKHIPKHEEFYSKLREEHVSFEDWQLAKTVFKKFKCDSLKSYAELYCLTDVAILAEVFLQFRKICFDNFGLDCAWYVSTPQLAFDAMLRMTKVEISLMHDESQILFMEANVRGGLSYISQRYCEEKSTNIGWIKMLLIDGKHLRI